MASNVAPSSPSADAVHKLQKREALLRGLFSAFAEYTSKAAVIFRELPYLSEPIGGSSNKRKKPNPKGAPPPTTFKSGFASTHARIVASTHGTRGTGGGGGRLPWPQGRAVVAWLAVASLTLASLVIRSQTEVRAMDGAEGGLAGWAGRMGWQDGQPSLRQYTDMFLTQRPHGNLSGVSEQVRPHGNLSGVSEQVRPHGNLSGVSEQVLLTGEVANLQARVRELEQVDIVIPWPGKRAGDVSGDRDDGVIRYTIRSVLKHMPWARAIYIFADPAEPPKWLVEFGNKVRLVDRCAPPFGAAKYCPTQNIYSVHANFHTIPDLADHFVVCDDDVIITSPLTREHFFADGKVVASFRGTGSGIYSGISTANGVSYVTELATPYHDGGKRALPAKLPKQINGVSHTPYGLLKSEIEKMHAEYYEWFVFVSAHRTRLCFHSADKKANEQQGNITGACWHENSRNAIMWYLHSKGLVVPPQSGRSVPECSAKYDDITEETLGKLLVPGSHAAVNINDSVIWRSKDIVALSKDSAKQAQYEARKRYLHRTLNTAFPLAKCPWSNFGIPTSKKSQASLDNNYKVMSTFYSDTIEIGEYLGPLVGGGMRCMYLAGEVTGCDNADSDIDLSGGDKGHKTPASLKRILPKSEPPLSFSSRDFSAFGVCECGLPNGRPFVCLRDVRQFMVLEYGESWWVPIPGMKRTVLHGLEKRKNWANPVLNSLRKYQNQDGAIDALSLSSVRPANMTDVEVQAAAAEMNALLRDLNKLAQKW